ncbi:hypothetical protein Kpol_1040p18 [Vanderwaltozyma polyspora DSM 70294]|uniref:Glutathione synthetase n=1 Tax=Vanderwaltozyma polyspora (strain ATCC 22028 / DSM 70294 / BCRC 21397 / CBS 2163 / NBRC 10782 / NRRL Y-8283 / UCD 57-17) TaxID=436907 RepID=A7TPL3_VANPO|nr:uncharacterized protein Kpol_1040p18 [Vanderwaltozyma polyspora DSM 70294]EDO15805.1 hypothetical protein Kpol_1040p18 [Vanderwaltozyma polyspora DSM 70294]
MFSESFRYPSLPDEYLKEYLLPEIYQWSLSNGLIMYPPDFKPESTSIAPTTVFPTTLPKESFNKAIDVQKDYNELYAKISQDQLGWLTSEAAELAKSDPDFTGKLWDTYLKASKIGIKQKLRLGLFRSDYLIDKSANEIKQVEFNTVSVSFGGLSTKVGELHQFLNQSGKYDVAKGLEYYKYVPVSDSDVKLAEGLAKAVDRYDSISGNACVLFVVQNGERNVFDQRILEYNLLKLHGIKSKRMTFDEIPELTKLGEDNRLLIKATNEEVAVVYFRSGYAPTDFKTDKDWDTRLYLETSYAIKAPDLLTQLSGAKKIQQLLTEEIYLRKFVKEDDIVKKLTSTFVNIYPLDNTSLGNEGKRLAFESPEKFVLKPQREGGGNNIYKEDIPKFLNSIDEGEWNAYVLMELIKPEETMHNIIIRGDEYFKEAIISELGIFGYILFDDDTIYNNEYAGWLLRSKFNSSNEGGVAAGFGCVDSVVLY